MLKLGVSNFRSKGRWLEAGLCLGVVSSEKNDLMNEHHERAKRYLATSEPAKSSKN